MLTFWFTVVLVGKVVHCRKIVVIINEIILIALLFFLQEGVLIAQDTITPNDIYYHKNIAYKSFNDSVFSGVIQKKKRNGRIKWDELYFNGIRTEHNLYFRMKEKKLANKYFFYLSNPSVVKREILFNSNSDTLHIKDFDLNGKKTKLKRFKDNVLIYSCEYKNGKRHGKEILSLCNEINVYKNGKKINNIKNR